MVVHLGITALAFPLRPVLPATGNHEISRFSRAELLVCMRCSSTAPGLAGSRVIDPTSVAFRTRRTASAPGSERLFAALSPRLHTPCQRFDLPLTVGPHDSGPGWFRYLLSCVTLSFTTPRRFIPTLPAGRQRSAPPRARACELVERVTHPPFLCPPSARAWTRPPNRRTEITPVVGAR